jgi:hypothetical protein
MSSNPNRPRRRRPRQPLPTGRGPRLSLCQRCGRPFRHIRKDAKYCGWACRYRGYFKGDPCDDRPCP